MTTVFSMTPFRDVHVIHVKSQEGRLFTIDIFKIDNGFESEVTIEDNISVNKGSWAFSVKPDSPIVTDNFRSALELIEQYMHSNASNDLIHSIHNKCNCSFINEADQNITLSSLGYKTLTVLVN